MDGLRNFVEVDNHSALDVGYLKEGTSSFLWYERPKFEEGCSQVSIRQGPEELTLRTEEVGSEKACIKVDHIAEDRWGHRHWWMLIGMLFAKRSTKELKAETGKNCTSTTKK